MDTGNLCYEFCLGAGATLGDGYLLGSTLGTCTQFETKSRTPFRHPTFSIFAGLQGDITSDGVVAEYTRRAEDSLKEPNYGTGTVTISDDEQKYIENGHSVFKANDSIMIFAGFENDNIPRFSGIIRDVQLQSDSNVQVLTIAELGYRLRMSKTSGDHSGYDSPKLLVDYLGARALIGDIVYEDESGPPTTFTFGQTFLSLRTYWAMIHGAALCMNYLQHFDERGRLNLTRRTSFEDTGYIFTDSEIESLTHLQFAKLINHKTIDYIQSIRPEFTAGDGVVAGQHTRSSTDSTSKHKYGEHENQETDELIGTWSNAGLMIDQILDYFPFPRQIYQMTIRALPQMQIGDRFFISSDKTSISGYFIIIGIKERLSATSYTGAYTIISEGERF